MRRLLPLLLLACQTPAQTPAQTGDELTDTSVSLPPPVPVRVDGVVANDSLQPRITVLLSAGPVDPGSFTSDTVYIAGPDDSRVGIEQRISDPEQRSIHFLPARYLAEDTSYRVVVDGLTVGGEPVEPSEHPLETGRFTHELDPIRDALDASDPGALEVLAETTTKLVWTVHRATLPAGTRPELPWFAWEAGSSLMAQDAIFAEAGGEPVDLVYGESGMREGPVPAGDGPVRIFQRFTLWVPPGIGAVSVGRFESRWHLDEERVLKPDGEPSVVWFTRYVPLGEEPAGGWPTVIFGNGYRSHRHHAVGLAPALAAQGLATIAFNSVGHGGGPDGTVEAGDEILPDGGRAVDVDGDGFYALEEGMRTDSDSDEAIRGLTDGVRQTVVDAMALARSLDAPAGYFGVSNGGRMGGVLVAIDPLIETAVLNVPPSEAFLPLADAWRPVWTLVLEANDLINEPHPHWGGFTEDIPFRGEPVQIGLAPGAEAIHDLVDRARRASTPMNTAAYAARYHALGKRVLVQIGRGDTLVVNPSTADLVREGDLQATTCLVWPERSAWFDQFGNGDPRSAVHVFTFMPNVGPTWHPGLIGHGARDQVVTWIASGGEDLLDPDPDGDLFGLGDVFEVPLSDESLTLLDRTFGFDPAEL